MKVVSGDLHIWKKDEFPVKYKQAIMFLDWFFAQDFNNSSNDWLCLGDIWETISSDYETLGSFLYYIFEKSKFKKITILQGNHDCSYTESVLELLKDIPNLEIIDNLTYRTEENGINYLYLPHYEYVNTNKPEMYEYYNTWVKEHKNELKAPLYVFGHLETDDTHFGDKYFITKELPRFNNKGNDLNILFGHIHTPNFMNGGVYLGSVIKNSSTEKDDKKYLALISDDGCWTPYEIPNFMSYATCEYGEVPKFDTPLLMLQVNNAPTKRDAEKFYLEKIGENVGFTKIYTKRDALENRVSEINDNSDIELFDSFAKDQKLSDDVINLCKKII